MKRKKNGWLILKTLTLGIFFTGRVIYAGNLCLISPDENYLKNLALSAGEVLALPGKDLFVVKVFAKRPETPGKRRECRSSWPALPKLDQLCSFVGSNSRYFGRSLSKPTGRGSFGALYEELWAILSTASVSIYVGS